MFVEKKACRDCGGKNLIKFLDLGTQALANSFLAKRDLSKPEPKYPLAVNFCRDCNLVQLTGVVSKEEMFSHYIYFSSGMPKLSDHFRIYAEDVMKRFLQKEDFVVELASNDGILLKFFQDAGYKTLGIDPAKNVVKIAESIGVHTIVDFFSSELAKKVAADYGRAKIIMANNVVAHIDDHRDLAKGLSELLAEDGVFVFEAPYLADMFENLTYDTIYHEHLSYLAVRPVKKLFEQFGMELFDVQVHPVQGQSLRCFAGRAGKHPISPNVKKYIDLELAMGFDKLEVYQELAKRVQNQKLQLTELLGKLKREGKSIAAYGAPAKGNTMLNYCNIGPDILEFALEDLPAKQNMFTPGMRIPTVDAAYAHSHEPDYYLMLAWNYEKPILEKEKNFLAKGGHFIVPVEGIRMV